MARRAPAQLRSWRRHSGSLAVDFAAPALLFGAWWVISSRSSSLYFPPLSQILSTLQRVWLHERFVSDALPSLEHLALGYLIALFAGVSLGIALGLAPRTAKALTPMLETLRAVPAIALVPAALLIFGIGTTMQVVIIASSAVWPILLNTVDGVRGIDPLVADMARCYRVRRRDRLLRLVLPAASPQIVAGMRTAVSISVVTVVVSEIIGATNGIGYQLLAAQRAFDIPGMWAAMLLLGILGSVLNTSFRLFESRVLAWHVGMNRLQG